MLKLTSRLIFISVTLHLSACAAQSQSSFMEKWITSSERSEKNRAMVRDIESTQPPTEFKRQEKRV